MNRFRLLAFMVSILLAGCTAPAFLMNPPEPSPLSLGEKVQQTMEALVGRPISKAIQKWGVPHGLTDDATGSCIYIWQVPGQEFLAPQDNRILSRRHSKVLNGVAGPPLPAADIYELMFYTDLNGVIYKTLTKKHQASAFSSRHFSFTK